MPLVEAIQQDEDLIEVLDNAESPLGLSDAIELTNSLVSGEDGGWLWITGSVSPHLTQEYLRPFAWRKSVIATGKVCVDHLLRQ